MSFPSKKQSRFLLWILVFSGLYLVSRRNYQLFHTLAEIFSIIIACGAFMVAWHCRKFLEEHSLLFLGVAYLFVGGLDFLHTLTYKGMGVFANQNPNIPTQLWIGARYLESLSLLGAPLFLRRKLRVVPLFSGFLLLTSLLTMSIFSWQIFPDCFVEGVGLTSFKKISEYLICFILLGAIGLLLRNRAAFGKEVLRLLVLSILLTIGAELAFTFYASVFGFSNLAGHFLKILSFYLIYKAIIETALVRPYELLFRNLKESEEKLERRVAERTRELELAHSKLLHAEKLSLVGKLAASIAHELNNPLFGIRNVLGGIQQRVALEEEDGELVEIALRECDRIKFMIRDLQGFNRPTSGEPEPVQVHKALDDMLLLVKKEFKNKRIRVEKKYAPDPLVLRGVQDQLKQVFLNLLTNAADAGQGKGGTITITTEAGEDRLVRIRFTDTGSGIAPDDLDRIFEPFFTTKPETEGTGLGLSVSRGIIENHGGRIEVESTRGVGTTFTVTLPGSRKQDEQEAA